MSWQRIGENARQHAYGVPVTHVKVDSDQTVDRLVTAGWRLSGLCVGDQTEAWFAQKGSHAARRAKRACSMCPVREACLGSALLHGEEFGVWGGLDPDDREPLENALMAGVSLESVLTNAMGERHAAS